MGGSDEFGEIAERTGFKERDVIEVMRRELKPSSFRRIHPANPLEEAEAGEVCGCD